MKNYLSETSFSLKSFKMKICKGLEILIFLQFSYDPRPVKKNSPKRNFFCKAVFEAPSYQA